MYNTRGAAMPITNHPPQPPHLHLHPNPPSQLAIFPYSTVQEHNHPPTPNKLTQNVLHPPLHLRLLRLHNTHPLRALQPRQPTQPRPAAVSEPDEATAAESESAFR